MLFSSKMQPGAGGLERRVGRAAVWLGVLWVACAYVWMPTWTSWVVHLVALETALGASLAAGLGALVLRPWRWSLLGRADKSMIAMAVVVVAAGVLPWMAVRRVTDAPLSLRAYVTGNVSPIGHVERDVVLVPDSSYRADVYPGAGPGPHPFVVVVHGGSWRGGSKGENAHVSNALSRAGFTVFDLDYPLAPEHPFPQAVVYLKCAVGRIALDAATWDIDPTRAAILGRSAGGQLAALAALTSDVAELAPACDVREVPFLALISIYAPADLALAHSHPVRPDVVDGPAALEAYLSGTPGTAASRYALASPTMWAAADRPTPKTLLIHGGLDRIVSTAHLNLWVRARASAGQETTRVLVPLGEHGFDHRPGGWADQMTTHTLLQFLRGTLGPARADD